ncbi:YidC/Oxa1 family membrane protein insertase, partial [bacterium]|nr:YidC/Oxa1 family membrane protein insertase [bacterium]
LITLYQVFRDLLINKNTVTQINELVYSFLRLPAGAVLQTKFFYLDLAKPDTFLLGGKPFPGLFLWLAVIAQFFSAKLSLPRVKKEEKLAGKTVSKEDDFAVAFQKQSLYLFPLMTLIFGLNFPSGLVVYWAVSSLANLFQQLVFQKISWSKGGKKNG